MSRCSNPMAGLSIMHSRDILEAFFLMAVPALRSGLFGLLLVVLKTGLTCCCHAVSHGWISKVGDGLTSLIIAGGAADTKPRVHCQRSVQAIFPPRDFRFAFRSDPERSKPLLVICR